MEKVASLRGTSDFIELPLGIVRPSKAGLNWLRGIRGELKMAERLWYLGSGWTVLHSVPVGNRGSDIDHLVIGPGGIFTINSKRLIDRRVWVGGGKFLVDGHRRDYLRNAEYEGRRVASVLERSGLVVPVTPVIAISGATSITIKDVPSWKGVPIWVLDVNSLAPILRGGAAVLSHDDVARITGICCEPKSWSPQPSANDVAAVEEVRRVYDLIDRGTTRWTVFIVAIGLAFFASVALVMAPILGALFSGR
jgi:hypothetical protein